MLWTVDRGDSLSHCWLCKAAILHRGGLRKGAPYLAGVGARGGRRRLLPFKQPPQSSPPKTLQGGNAGVGKLDEGAGHPSAGLPARDAYSTGVVTGSVFWLMSLIFFSGHSRAVDQGMGISEIQQLQAQR